MDRRNFLSTMGALPVALQAQEGPPAKEARYGTRYCTEKESSFSSGYRPCVQGMTAPNKPTIGLNHLGFRPRTGRKVLVVRAFAPPRAREFTLRDESSETFHFTRPLAETRSDFGPCLTADFTDLERPGKYQITVGNEGSVPFFIDEYVWRRTLPKAVGYYRYQRCGVEVPGVHPACHLDDARRRDNGQHVDVVGGWHDAGDVRKWMDWTMLNGLALLNLLRNIPEPRPGDPTHEQILEEVRFGNRYFLKMQDADGKVWADTAGGVNGDNSDNHWTDNIIGTADDRYINTDKPSGTAAVFATLQGLAAQCYAQSDGPYAKQCLEAGVRAWSAFGTPEFTQDVAWWTVAACELFRATKDPEYRDRATLLGRSVLSRQNTSFIGDQKQVRGFWMNGNEPYVDVTDSALPPLALLELLATFPEAEDRNKWKDAVQLHIDEYLMPMAERNAYRIIPLGLYLGSPTPETYRPLAGRLTYRYFHAGKLGYRRFYVVRDGDWWQDFNWQGANCHLAANALLLARFARVVGDKGNPYVDLAYRQLEWIMGANPFAACMMTGEGMRNPYPHSVFVGLIPGGIINGISGNADDEPILDMEYSHDWRTCEYWSPHVAYYIWANSVLENMG
jgi:hypothetical protein